jgi:site-specific DNA recombinase
VSRLTQVDLPRGIRFIAIQERVDILTGDGVEMTPFHNISKEWYAAQTSKKIRAVWQAKADNGRRVSSAVPFGHMKAPNDKEKWLIDEPAAKAVRKIYALCLAGRGASQIARQLEKEQILIINASTDYMRKR